MSTKGNFQEDHYDVAVDYSHGSPHLSNLRLRQRLVGVISVAITELADRKLPLRVLEVGAGHGGYTEPMLAMGCAVTAVEISGDAAKTLAAKYRTNSNLAVVYDPDGSLKVVGGGHSLLACISVLHHIPDYLAFVHDALSKVRLGGSFVCLQDPLWYARVPAAERIANRGAYLAWRVLQGNRSAGFATLSRRVRGVYDDRKPGDMVEYHVVRKGVDEEALAEMLRDRFEAVTIIPYWSNQSAIMGKMGARLGWQNTFGIHATGFRGGSYDG